jgi:hypothetical protein
MARWNDLIAALGVSGRVENPYWNLTKGEMAAQCANRTLLADLVPTSLSCASPTKAAYRKLPGRSAAIGKEPRGC